jgi:hypothetical protein
MVARRRVTPKKVTTKPAKPASAGAAYRQSLRERTAASNAFARRDVGYERTAGDGSPLVKGTVKPGQYIPLYNDVSKTYNAIRKHGTTGYGGGDFPMAEAKANTFKGKQYLKNTGGTLTSNYQVKAGTIAGPKTTRDPVALKAQALKNAARDGAINARRKAAGLPPMPGTGPKISPTKKRGR